MTARSCLWLRNRKECKKLNLATCICMEASLSYRETTIISEMSDPWVAGGKGSSFLKLILTHGVSDWWRNPHDRISCPSKRSRDFLTILPLHIMNLNSQAEQ